MKIKILRIILLLEIIVFVYFCFNIHFQLKNNSTDNNEFSRYSEQEISSFNSSWEAYIGNNRTVGKVKTLISAAIANNAVEKNSGSERLITINGKEPTRDLFDYYHDESLEYTITPKYDDLTGLITNMDVIIP